MAGPWDKYAAASPQQGGQVFSLPAAPDPDKAVRSQLLQLELQSKLKDAQAGAQTVGPSSLSGPSYLKTLDPATSAIVQALADGRKSFPTGMSLKSPYWQTMLQHVANYDPGFDEVNYTSRAATRKDFTSGKAANNIRALNTAIGHLGHLATQIDGTASHGGFPLATTANAIQNAYERGKGDPGITNYQTTAGALAGELTAVYRGSGGAEADIQRYIAQLDPNASADQKKAAIGNIMSLLKSRIDALNDQYTKGMGTTAKPLQLLDPNSQKLLGAYGAGADLPPGGNPPADGSGSPPQEPVAPASGPTRTEVVRGPVEQKLSAMLAGGAPSPDIRKFASDNGYAKGKIESVLAWRALNPTYKGGYDVHQENIVPTTLYNRAAASPLAAGALSAVDAGTAGLTDEAAGAVNAIRNGGSLSDNVASSDYAKQLLMAANPKSSLAGSVIGGAGVMIGGGLAARSALEGSAMGRGLLGIARANPIKAAALGDAVYGGAYGAGENNDNRALGAGVGSGVGLIASPVGAGATKAVGSVIGGIANPAVRRLQAAGIPLTVGEALGGGFKKAQDAVTSVFGPGNMVSRRYMDGRRALNEVGYNTAGNVIGSPINAVGENGINKLDAAKSRAFSNALDPVSIDLNTPQFQAMRNTIDTAAQSIPDVKDAQGLATSGLQTYIDGPAQNGIMSGRDFQEGYRGLSRLANQPETQPYGYEIGQVANGGKIALASALQDQNPGAYEGFLNANSAHRMLSILAKAHNAAKNQIADGGEVLWTPAQLGNASTANAIKYGSPIAAAGGNRPFNQLINDSQQVMSSKLPESGTFPRALMGAALMGGGGGLGYGANGGEGALEGASIPMLGATLLGSRLGQQLLIAALTKRTVADQLTARAIRKGATYGGDALAGATIPLLDSPSQ